MGVASAPAAAAAAGASDAAVEKEEGGDATKSKAQQKREKKMKEKVAAKSEKTAESPIVIDGNSNVAVVLDFTEDETLLRKAMIREVTNRVQKMRKACGLTPTDCVDMWALGVDKADEFAAMLQCEAGYVATLLRRPLNDGRQLSGKETRLCEAQEILVGRDQRKVRLLMTVPEARPTSAEIKTLAGGDEKVMAALVETIRSFELGNMQTKAAADKNFQFKIGVNGTQYTLTNGKHFTI
eukprot:Selendium_serpulae@DN5379_c0_g1_i3.p3